MNIKDLPVNERPVERVMHSGAGNLTNAELIALILRTGVGEESAIGLSERIICSLEGGLRGLMNTTPQELMKIRGVGMSKACALAAVSELVKRMPVNDTASKIYIESAREAAQKFMEDLRYEKKEHFKTVLLDTKGKVIHIDEVSIGGLATAPVHPREVFAPAIKRSASGIILVHNHPSGDPAPSMADDYLTERLNDAGKLLGIRVLDHIIIGDGEYYSFAGSGKLES